MIGRAGRAIARLREVGPALLCTKLRLRLWSRRTAIVVGSDTARTTVAPSKVDVRFTVVPSATIAGDLQTDGLRGADRLYVEGLIRIFGGEPGEAIAGRTGTGLLAAVGLMSCERHRAGLESVAPGLYPRLPLDECWTEAHYVFPAFRNQRIMGAMLGAERDYLREAGVRRVNAVIDLDNVASLRAFAREGYRPTGLSRTDRYRLNRRSSEIRDCDPRTLDQWRRVTGEPG